MAENGEPSARATPYIIGGGLGLLVVAATVLWIIAANPGVGPRRVSSGPRATAADLERWDTLATDASSRQTRQVEMVVPDGDSGEWVTYAESVTVPTDEGLRLGRVVVTWLRRVAESGSGVARSARLLSAHVDDGRRAYVNLSAEFVDGNAGLTAETEFVIGLAKTIRANLPTIVDVQLLVDGQEIDTIGGQLDISAPLSLAQFAEMK
ncbi:GerMN domain-containing protein [Candidatus Poribacteria bacterium]|nr:GerMN domain-containing protein [Candidatus Poribacteria bacterium]MBT5537145.1 GerMN domain-containing protein [Candidatus Poribacteria bacterium]MBT5713501.1 GerMN domain-containing protein [Candidatus Poribacteria bacterium]MBT7097893.1 GerMN domain-containing protein [Candidatus Poribacteria bacterium]MBT7808284.1 GerMN domain-containing protein [Candidatus Poribacteria bacterium]